MKAGMVTGGAVLAASIAAAALGYPALMVLGIVLSMLVLLWTMMTAGREARAGGPLEELHPQDRAYVTPIIRLHRELQEVVEKGKTPTASIIGAEAVQESQHIVDQCIRMVALRSELRKALGRESHSSSDLDDLQRKLEQAPTETEREAFASAIEARSKEMEHYAYLRESIAKIDSGLRQAEAALAEMKARLAVSEAAPLEENDENSIATTVNRLRSLGVSFDEAEELLRQRL